MLSSYFIFLIFRRLKRLLLFWSYLLPILLYSQQHPLALEHASLLESGYAQFDFGFAYYRNQPYPLSGLQGHLLKVGSLRYAAALSSYIELQVDGTLLNLLDIQHRRPAFNSNVVTRSNPTGDIGDFTVWTKFGVLSEYRQGVGVAVRFGIQLPNASNESGLGVDEMNFYSLLLIQKHLGGKLTANIGLGILSDPAVLGQQHDVLLYGFEYMVPVGSTTSLRAQTSGRTGHSGIGIQRLANAKLGMEHLFGPVSVTWYGVVNTAPSDNAKGMELSVAYLFHIIDMNQ